jgi:GNAT superfamily N-acetyltransferase
MREPRNLRFWHQWLRPGDVAVIGEADGCPIGAAWIRDFAGSELGPWDNTGVPQLAIAVEQAWRGRGIGRALMTALLNAARASGVRHVELTTGSFNEAGLRLYRSAGFVETARLQVDDDSYAIRMRADLVDVD